MTAKKELRRQRALERFTIKRTRAATDTGYNRRKADEYLALGGKMTLGQRLANLVRCV